MNTYTKLFVLASVLVSTFFSHAQTDPGTTNLVHQWTFDEGTANDKVGTANGSLIGGATIVNKALKLASSGQYLNFSGTSLALNTYTDISQEIWFTSVSGANTGYTMLSYFGNTSGGGGYNYISTSAARGDNVSRTCITSGTYSSEKGVNGTEYDDGKLHQMISIIRADSVILYIDGNLIGKTASGIALSTVGTSLAYLGKGGYTSDPTWLGMISKFSIYNKTLTANEVKFLYQKGAEESEYIASTTTSLSFDEFFKVETLKINSLNLSNPITITAPAGVTVTPTSLAANVSSASVSIIFDGSTTVDGNIVFTSGNGVLNIPVKSYTNSCYTKLYPELTNYVSNPYMNVIPASWGNVSLAGGSDAFCGSHCVKIAGTGGCSPNGGSISTPSITWIPNATYRFHAKVRTSGTFNMGVQNANVGGATGDYNIVVPNTNGVWADFDATFTAGSSPTPGTAFFNNCGSSSGLTAYIDNWELYSIPSIATSTSSITLDDYAKTTSFTVSGVNLTEAITIASPLGITLDNVNLAANVSAAKINVTYDGTSVVNGNITLTSGTLIKNISIKSLKNSDCFTTLFPEGNNLIPDPYLNDLTKFTGSWGTRSANTNTSYVFCGASSGKVTDYGSITKNLTGVMKPNTTYRVKAKVFKLNPGNVTYNMAIDKATLPNQYNLIKIAMDSACSLFNQHTPLSANIYVYYSSGIPTAQASNYGSIGFGASTTYMWVGTTIHEMAHYFGSGTNSAWKNKVSNGKWTGTVANNLIKQISNDQSAVISSDGTHFWPQGINYRSEIENLGSYSAQLTGLINSVKITKAMIVDDAGLGTNKKPVGVGVFGWNGTTADIYNEVTTTNKWQDVDFTFTTGNTLGTTQGVYFNSGSGYIDNWEMYDLGTGNGLNDAIKMNVSAYVSANKLTSEFELDNQSNVELSVFDLQGKLLLKEMYEGNFGKNKITTDFSATKGLYILRIKTNDSTCSIKIMNK